MVVLCPYKRSLPGYRMSFLVNDDRWLTSRVPLYYLNVEVSNETLFQEHFENLFPDYREETGDLGDLEVSDGQRFHLDDASVGLRNSNFFFCSLAVTLGKVDRIGMERFVDFTRSLKFQTELLKSGKSAEWYLNLATLVGYQQWQERVLPPPYDELQVDHIFAYIYPSILIGVYQKKSENPLLVKKLWDVFCLSEKTHLMLFKYVPDAEHLKFQLEVAKSLKFEFWGMRSDVRGLIEHVFIHYVKEKRFDLITLMLDYGFTLTNKVISDTDQTYYSDYVLTESLLDYNRQENLYNDSMVLFLLSCYISCDCEIELPEFIKIYQKLSRTCPEPSLPSSILKKHLQKTFDQFEGDYSEDIEELIAIYELCDVHPPDSSVVAPQTLSHLSRCVIRDRLAANHQLPTAIDDLRLPTFIKDFLRADF